MTIDPLDFNEDEADDLAKEGMARALSAVEAWRKEADAWFASVPNYSIVTADDLVASIGLPDSGAYKNNAVGGWFSGKAKLGLLTFVEFTKSARVIGHGNTIRKWKVTRP